MPGKVLTKVGLEVCACTCRCACGKETDGMDQIHRKTVSQEDVGGSKKSVYQQFAASFAS